MGLDEVDVLVVQKSAVSHAFAGPGAGNFAGWYRQPVRVDVLLVLEWTLEHLIDVRHLVHTDGRASDGVVWGR